MSHSAQAQCRVLMEEDERGAERGVGGPPRVGRNLKAWLQDQYCDHDLEQCQDTLLHNAACVGDIETLRTLLQEERFLRYGADVDVDRQLSCGSGSSSPRILTSLTCTPLYISAAYDNLPCFRLLLQAGANPDYNSWSPVYEGNLARSSPSCLLEAVLSHGCDKQYVQLLIDFGATLSLLHTEPSCDEHSRKKVNPEALQVFREAKCFPRTLTSLCRIAVRRAIGKQRLYSISVLPVPHRVIRFLLYEQ
ncbi:ankyrin repeat and SOCS box protein 1 isoform X2 [Hyla sarda]|uniref:ankyrin repeat and SOCS box protein 1 isoform X2 n=1 Tax=Hyla sarda TaxID=327740 RepID=UPI0024C417FC|nr:ankyrin repeat and SOCS box protein 1 isoform X2 [Hyla sarda]